jgi:hypothetical protein
MHGLFTESTIPNDRYSRLDREVETHDVRLMSIPSSAEHVGTRLLGPSVIQSLTTIVFFCTEAFLSRKQIC